MPTPEWDRLTALVSALPQRTSSPPTAAETQQAAHLARAFERACMRRGVPVPDVVKDNALLAADYAQAVSRAHAPAPHAASATSSASMGPFGECETSVRAHGAPDWGAALARGLDEMRRDVQAMRTGLRELNREMGTRAQEAREKRRRESEVRRAREVREREARERKRFRVRRAGLGGGEGGLER
ncbi:hypothetical protein JCM8097_002196 [Rhodosporidiobolus ruineniae]